MHCYPMAYLPKLVLERQECGEYACVMNSEGSLSSEFPFSIYFYAPFRQTVAASFMDNDTHPESVFRHRGTCTKAKFPYSYRNLTHDGAADEENNTTEENNQLLGEKIEHGRRAYINALQWWADEYKAAIICGLSIVILNIVLWYFDGKLAPRLSPGIDLDMVVIAMVTVSRVAIGSVVEACISQCAWIWISKTHQLRTNTVARLEDFKLFDEASRGFLGSVALVLRMKGLYVPWLCSTP